MSEQSAKKAYRKPQLMSEKVFEQAALSCVVTYITGAPATVNTLKISGAAAPAGTTGCGYTSS